MLLLLQDVTHSIVTKWKQSNYSTSGYLLLEYDSLLLHALTDYINYCVRFAWCALTQVPPLNIDHSAAVYSSKCHVVSQAFSPSERWSPTRRSGYIEGHAILCHLWPVLKDCDGHVIKKGEVVLASYR